MVNIVYDMDDVLNNLNEVVFDKLGLQQKLKNLKYYNINKNDNLTDSEKANIISSYSDAQVFKALTISESAKRIIDIEHKYPGKVKVWIHSLSLNAEIAKVKEAQIRENIPTFNMENAILEVGSAKSSLDFADIVIEDSIENLAKYTNCIKVLVDRWYNQGNNYDIDSSDMIRELNLSNAIDTIERIVEGILSGK